MKLNKKFLIPVAVLACAGAYICFEMGLFEEKKERVEYKQFYSEVEQGQIQDAKVTEKGIVYTKDGDRFVTDNPHSPLLEEFMMRNGTKVTVEKDSAELINAVLDVIFYLIFFGVLVIGFKRVVAPNSFKVEHKTGKTFDDVIGMDELKQEMRQIMDIMKNQKLWAKNGVRMPKGILLEGSPGNGKTLFAKALAGEAKVNFIPTKATDFESMFMAIGPMKVKMLFRKARRLSPCIIFIDEFDGIGTRRNYSGSAIETENTRIVTALLNELDGFRPNSGILVVAATNSVSALDEALIRPGRFDARYTVPYPDENTRAKLVEMYTKQKKMGADCTSEILAKKFSGYSCAKIESVLNRAVLIANRNNREEVTLKDVEDAAFE